MTLDKLLPGECGRVIAIKGSMEFCKRIIEMGLVEGCVVEVCRRAPLGDPIDIKVKNFHLSLRKQDARGIVLQREFQG